MNNMDKINELYHQSKPEPEYTGYKAISKVINVLFGSGLITVSIIMLISFMLSDKHIWFGAYLVFIVALRAGWYLLTHPER